jgi:hypothetical protein
MPSIYGAHLASLRPVLLCNMAGALVKCAILARGIDASVASVQGAIIGRGIQASERGRAQTHKGHVRADPQFRIASALPQQARKSGRAALRRGSEASRRRWRIAA